jgi:hypothetical protein
VEQSSGEFSAVIDSDDWYRPDALERLLFHWYSIRADQKPSFGNVEALCAYPSGSLIGTRFPKQVLDSDAFEVQYVHKVLGDKVGMYRTEVLRSYPFPENLGPFVPESIVWNRIAMQYRGRYINEVLGYKEYLPSGLSARTLRDTVKASRAYAVYLQQVLALCRWRHVFAPTQCTHGAHCTNRWASGSSSWTRHPVVSGASLLRLASLCTCVTSALSAPASYCGWGHAVLNASQSGMLAGWIASQSPLGSSPWLTGVRSHPVNPLSDLHHIS